MAISYDQHVKRPHQEFEYEPEHIKELQLCSEDIYYFLKYVKIVNPDRGEEFFQPYDYQVQLLKKFQHHRFNICLLSRQSGKTTVVAVYALWYSIFNPDKVIGIVSNKESSAKMILARIRRMYECLPVWLKPGVKDYSKTYVTFDNNSQIKISATSEDAFRGESMNLLICDEFAFVAQNQAEEFWASNYPTISASKEAKIVIISTPNGMFNIFHRLYSQAERGENTFAHTKVSWDEVPGRDKKWADEQLKNLGKQKFRQEFAVEFLGSTNTVIDPDVLENIVSQWEDPIHIDLRGKLRIFEKPLEREIYVMGVDVAKGTGENSSTIQILKILGLKPIKMEQVAVYESNMIDVYQFTEVVNRLSFYYKNAFIMCENNSEGAAIVSRLWWEHENPNLVNSGSKNVDLGIRAKRTTKPKAVLLMKKLVEDHAIKLIDKETLNQLTTFIEISDNKFSGKDMPDDLVSALYWACYVFEMNVFSEGYELKRYGEDEGEDTDIWGILGDIEEDVENWNWMKDIDLIG
jgi:hypothetical protein